MSNSIKKKMMALVVAGVMALPMASFASVPVLIEENNKVVISENTQKENNYMNYSGTILDVNNEDGNMSILVNSADKEDKYGYIFHISDHVSVFNRESEENVKAEILKDGMKVEVFFHENTPTTMSIPPQLTPGVIVIQDKEVGRPTFVGEFDKELVSSDKQLQLNIGEETVIVSEKGEALTKEDIAGNAVLVFYGMSTKSIPAQTTPSKVVVLDEKVEDEAEEALEDEIEDEVEEDINDEVENKTMISLRETAKGLGYKVKWDNKAKTAEITKLNQTIVIKLDSVDYTLNKSLGKFSKAPELRNSRLYVQASVLDFME